MRKALFTIVAIGLGSHQFFSGCGSNKGRKPEIVIATDAELPSGGSGSPATVEQRALEDDESTWAQATVDSGAAGSVDPPATSQMPSSILVSPQLEPAAATAAATEDHFEPESRRRLQSCPELAATPKSIEKFSIWSFFPPLNPGGVKDFFRSLAEVRARCFM